MKRVSFYAAVLIYQKSCTVSVFNAFIVGTCSSLTVLSNVFCPILWIHFTVQIPGNNNSLTRVTDEDSVSGMQWLTNTCWLGADISGVWLSKRAQEAEITTINVNSANGLVAVGDNQGQVSVYRYPCTSSFVSLFLLHTIM